ncbi:MAG: bifunctional diaminohydroxyphosphoribosylaminopyrimidine deaminase/5-amino-6-(5-phosphoribosylamino)uracil reductase RibD [Actinomycetota bacterium]|nr:bifunctional diaminohydroxyphosphoribosylaminopyrimidine deaminase/5-amino-6-(5-phosphoribosylamino)uracil reductase RibD [Actinomycetota bacterium]
MTDPPVDEERGSPGGRGRSRRETDEQWMDRALAAAATVRGRTSPNPWVGAVVVPGGGSDLGGPSFVGVTAPPGGPHAEITALERAREARIDLTSATLYVTLEPCSHTGRTPPCVDAIVAAHLPRVVVGIGDPDPRVDGRGIAALRAAGVEVTTGVRAAQVADQLAPYLAHRRTGRPFVVLKLAATLDGRTAAPDGSSRWITGPAARLDVHRLRSRSDAILVGAGTVRADDPALTVRLPRGDPDWRDPSDQPLRVVLGQAPPAAAVRPALELGGDLGGVLDTLGERGVLQLMVEGGASVAHAFHRDGLVDRYVLYLAPALFGGSDARGMFAGPAAPTVTALWRGTVHSVTSLGGDLRVEIAGSPA